MKFLDTVFTNDDNTPDLHTIENIIQLGGYLIYPQIKTETMFIFYGTGANGKSLLIDYVFKKFFDRKFISSLSLNLLSSETTTSRHQLMYSRVNFATEQKSSESIESEELKKVITGEDISIERKYEKTITFKPKCKIVVAGNRFMRFKDTSEGTRRRLMIFNFQNRFETNKQKYAELINPAAKRIFPAANKDELVSNLEKELPGILNLFLEGLQQLRENQWKFEESVNNKEVFADYLEESDYIGTWLSDNFTEDEESHISVKDVMEEYRSWWSYNFPEKRFDSSTKLISRRIKDVFRLEPYKLNIDINGKKTTTTAYSLKRKKDQVWDILEAEDENSQPPML